MQTEEVSYLRACRICVKFYAEEYCHRIDKSINPHIVDMLNECCPNMNVEVIFEPVICDICLDELRAVQAFIEKVRLTEETIKLFISTNNILYKSIELKLVNKNKDKLKPVDLHLKAFVKQKEVEPEPPKPEPEVSKNKVLKDKRDKLNALSARLAVLNNELNTITQQMFDKKYINEKEKLDYRLEIVEKDIKDVIKEIGITNKELEEIVLKDGSEELLAEKDKLANISLENEVEIKQEPESTFNFHIKCDTLKSDHCEYCREFKSSNLMAQMKVFQSTGSVALANKANEQLVFKRDPDQCLFCGLRFGNEEEVNKHKEIVHCLSKIHFCDICGKTFRKYSNMYNHKRQTHSIEATFSCETCGKGFKYKNSLRSHMRNVHKKATTKSYLCTQCGKVLHSNSSLYKHQQSHSTVKKWACQHCGKRFSSSWTLKLHEDVVHDAVGKFPCEHCEMCFARRDYYNRHLWQKHGISSKAVLCECCNILFKNEHELMLHQDRREGEVYNCEECGKNFKMKISLDNHKAVKHSTERNYMCNVCSKFFATSNILSRHQYMTHSGRFVQRKKESRRQLFMCSECPAKFNYITSYQNHVASQHSTERNYGCDLCDKTFATKSILYKHKCAVHQKDHLCRICGEVFTTPHYLLRHRKLEHSC